jgi:prepilin signal peptidase PulO-like enzyme (type II secretory pathway)
MGFGDVRLSVMLGVAVGVAAATTGRGWPWVIVLCMFSLGLAAIVGLLMGVPGLMIGRRHVPFGPALVTGALICVALAQPILEPFG